MSSLMPYVDVCIANEEDASDVFGTSSDGSNIAGGELNYDGYKQVAKSLCEKFNFKKVAITLRQSINSNENNWSAMLYENGEYYFSKKYNINIVDRIGSGDSFAAGLIYSLLSNYSSKDAVEFAVAASCLKHTIEGDYNLVTADEVKTLMNGNESGRVMR